jgi:hypothetical protein
MDDFQLTFGGAGESLHDTFLRFALDCIFDENAKEIVVAILTVTAALSTLTTQKGVMALSDVTTKLINRMIMFAAKAATSQVDDLGVYVAAYLSDAVAEKQVRGGASAFRSFLRSFSNFVTDCVAAGKRKVQEIMGEEAYAEFLSVVYASDEDFAENVAPEFKAMHRRRRKKNRNRKTA